MTMSAIDWVIVIALVVGLTIVSICTNRYARSVSGFLAANRCAGRYLIAIAYGMAQLGVITMVWYWQQNYDVGFTSIWWGFLEGPALILIALSGWVVYRFRQTRALTMAQFFEIRYSRGFRIFAGLVAFLAGIINYGIFPGVAARFFIHLCGLPDSFDFGELQVQTFPVLMGALLGIALVFVFLGGQIAVIVTDFIQGAFGNIVFIIIVVFLLVTIGWDRISEALLQAPPGRSMVDPFDLGQEQNFNPWYWVISIVVLFYGMLGWQGTSGYNASALNAHEAKMANILNGWRFRVLMLIVLVLPICIRVLMNDPSFQAEAIQVQATVAAQPTQAMGAEVRTPVATGILLPAGLLGLMCAAMLGAFISTNDTYLHAWGTIFIQDVVLPFRKKPLSPRVHLWLLRAAILGVALFAFFFSWWYTPTQYIAMFLAITGAIFVGGAGSAIIGGLYWKRGTTAAAWTAMITGMVLSCSGIVVKQLPPATFWAGPVLDVRGPGGELEAQLLVHDYSQRETLKPWMLPDGAAGRGQRVPPVALRDFRYQMSADSDDPFRALESAAVVDRAESARGEVLFRIQPGMPRRLDNGLTIELRNEVAAPGWSYACQLAYFVNREITGQVLFFWSIVAAVLLYVLVSLLGKSEPFDMDRLLHRGRYAGDDGAESTGRRRLWLERLGFSQEFTRRDQIVTVITLAWPIFWTIVFAVVVIRRQWSDIPDETWVKWWKWYTWSTLSAAIVVVIWFTIGGLLNVRDLFRRLRTATVDQNDDGRVIDHRNADEVESAN